MAHKGIKLGTISSHQIFSTLNKWHGLNTALRRILNSKSKSVKNVVSDKVSGSLLWERAVFALSARLNAEEIDGLLELREKGKSLSVEEEAYFRVALVALKLAKEVIKMQQEWRANAIAHLNRTGGFSRSLANSCTDWPCLLIELLSQAAETDHFQVKEVYGLENEVSFRNVIVPYENRPHPLYLGTATQIGAIPTEGIPSLLKVLLLSNCTGLPVLVPLVDEFWVLLG